MPCYNESKEKEIHSKKTERENVDEVFQWVRQEGAVVPPPDEGRGLSIGGNNDCVFSFIREVHLQEAQEFRRKGYNSQVPEVDPRLLTQLRDALSATESRLCLQTSVGGPLSSWWLLEQIKEIKQLAGKLSDDVIKSWVKHELPGKSGGETAETELGGRRTAQSLVRRLESTLQTLIRVVYTLRAIDDYSTPEKRHDMLVAELTAAFSSGDKSTVIQALGKMTAETSGHVAWGSLMQARAAVWEADKPASVDAMIEASRHEAEKANKKARNLHGASQTFFSDVAAYLLRLSIDLEKASINASQSTPFPSMPHVNNSGAVSPLSRLNSLTQRIKTDVDKKKLQVQTAVAGVKVHAHRLVRIIQHGHPTETSSKELEQVVACSIIRSILWQWQQPAIKIQYASAALLSKVDELKNIEGILASYAVADERGSKQESSNTTVSHVQVREWVRDSIEQQKTENQLAAKVATLERLLSCDIDHAQSVLARLGRTTESIQKELERQMWSVNEMLESRQPVDIARSMWMTIDDLMVKFRPDITRELATAAQALNDAIFAAGNSARNFSEAKALAGKAQLLATKVKQSLSAESARLTKRPLDEHSRGARLAKHWATLAKEQNMGNYPPLDAEQVLSAMKEQGLLVGTLSTGDPAGYLFATRLAGELENARNDELRLPMNPEQYTALEKGLVEHIVKWGQRRISRGVTRIVIDLSFEQALDTVSFNVSNLVRLPYKLLKASIKIPYNVNEVNNYTMPGHDKPYKAIYGLLGKKLKQLGFNLLVAPVPSVIKIAAGAGVTAGAASHNFHVGNREETFSAVYQHVAEGKKSEKIKMDSVKGMIFDSVIDIATMTAFKGGRRVWQSGKSEKNVISYNAFVSEHAGETNEEIHSQEQRGKMVTENDNPEWENAAENERKAVPVSHSSLLLQKTDAKPFSDERAPGSDRPCVRRKRAAADMVPPPSYHWNNRFPANVTSNSDHLDEKHSVKIVKRWVIFPPLLPEEKGTTILLSPNRNYPMYALIWVLENNDEKTDWVTVPDDKPHEQINTRQWGVIDVRYNKDEACYEISDNHVINTYITNLARMLIGSDEGLDNELERVINENRNVDYTKYISNFNESFRAENIEKMGLKAQEEEENNRRKEVLIEKERAKALEAAKNRVKKKHYDDNVLRYLDGRENEVDSTELKPLWPHELIIPDTKLKVSLASVINGDIPKDIVALLNSPEVIDKDEWQGIISGRLYNEIKDETDRLDEEENEMDVFITKTEEVIKKIQSPEEYIRQWIKNNSNLEPDDTYTFYIRHPLPDRFKGNNRIYQNQIDGFRRRHPDVTRKVTIYDIITGKMQYELNPYRSMNVRIDMPENSEVASLFDIRGEAISGYEKYLDGINNEHAKDLDNYFNLSSKLNIGTMNDTATWMEKLKEHLNEITYTETEIETNFALSVTSEVIGAVGTFVPLSPLKGFVFITGSQIGISLLQSENASSPEEKEMYHQAARKAAIYGAVLSTPGIIGSRTAGRVGGLIKKGYVRAAGNKIKIVRKPVVNTSGGTLLATEKHGITYQCFWSDNEGGSMPLSKLRKSFNSESGMPGKLQPKRQLPREFRMGQVVLLGKISGGKFYISLNNGATWMKGNKIHLAAYRLQNSGGVNKLHEEGESTSQVPAQSTNSSIVGMPPPPPAPSRGNLPPPPPMRIGKLPVKPGSSTVSGAVTSQSITFGPVKPKPLSGITETKVRELESLAFGSQNKPKGLSPIEERYYDNLVIYFIKKNEWNNYVNKGKAKYLEFHDAPPCPVSKTAEYHLRYEESISPETSTVPYINKGGNIAMVTGKVIDIHVKGESESYYKFRVSDGGKVFVVDNMYRNRDVQVTKAGIGNPLNMNEIQGEFMKKSDELLKNVEFITQENIANVETHKVMRLAFGENALRASANKPIVLKPTGETKVAFQAMLTTPNIQPTARMLSTYPEFGKQIKEIRIQSVTRITITLESADRGS
ncbi:hypothetical protein [Serratia fonticola]|uniref:hypothetical protein n=1 Tax=Serratia fonticola TaxID=47917 RepID=UPI00192D1863|nr:hypothetical protein [Serratia fonticola]MBL5829201.1 hypothetical protein [Serratia fonticola]